MTLDKAIEILSLDLTYTYPARFDDLQDAILLGIEALIAWRQCRAKRAPANLYLLPGETEV